MPAFADEANFIKDGWTVTYLSETAEATTADEQGSTLVLTGGGEYRVTRTGDNNCCIKFKGDGNTTVTLAGVDCGGNKQFNSPGLDAGRGASSTTLILEGPNNK